MENDGFVVQQRRRRGTDENFKKNHARLYGREEGLGPDGEHHHGSRFPRGSDREKLHTQYSKSTRPRDNSRTAYENGVLAARDELKRMGRKAQDYYERHTGGFAPHQHERLDPRATNYRDTTLENAEGRRGLLKEHPYGYHSARDQNKHHQWAGDAYDEYEYAKDRQQHHEKYRSYSNLDPRRDQWGRPVTYR